MLRAFDPTHIPKPRGLVDANWELIRRDFGGAIDLEIGCGVGMHPIRRALAHPSHFLVALERTREKFEKFERRYESHARPLNLLPVHADAVSWVAHRLPLDIKISRLFLLYPNPEPKAKSQRWIHMPFFEMLLTRVVGEVHLATNIASYFGEFSQGMRARGFMAPAQDTISLESVTDFKPRTHFESKYFLRGEKLFLGQFISQIR